MDMCWCLCHAAGQFAVLPEWHIPHCLANANKGDMMLRSLSVMWWQSLCLIIATAASLSAEDLPVVDSINAALQPFVDNHEISGAVTLVVDRNAVKHLGVIGLADLETGQPMQPETMFWIASMTKPISATAILMLQDEGLLSVDDPVSKYIPAFADVRLKNGERPQTVMTIRHLLTHTSGLDQMSVWKQSPPPNTRTLEAAANVLAATPLHFEPGTQWEYGQGISVAGRIAEIVAGRPFDQFLSERMLQPLKMEHTTFTLNAEQARLCATVYGLNGEQTGLVAAANQHVSPEPGIQQTPNPSAGLFSTARDYGRFQQLILNEGRAAGKQLISAESLKLLTTIQTGDIVTGFTPGNGWGLGWCVVREPQGVSAMLNPGSCGHGGAYGTQAWIDRERGLGMVLMIQRKDLKNSDDSPLRKAFQQATVEAFGR